MSVKTIAAFLCGVIAASTGTAAALDDRPRLPATTGRRSQVRQRLVPSSERNAVQPFECRGVPHYAVIYGPSEIRVLRVRPVSNNYVSRSVFHLDPTGS
jgi:hypothetical protein